MAVLLPHVCSTPLALLASAATAADGFALTRQGKGLKAIGTSTICSMIGGTISAIALLFIAPALSQVALKFSSLEYFLIGVFGLTIIGSLAGDNMMKGLLSGCLGLIIGCVGLDIQTSAPRYCFGFLELQAGINLVPAMIGLFSISQVMFSIEDVVKGKSTVLDENAKNLSGSPLLPCANSSRYFPRLHKALLLAFLLEFCLVLAAISALGFLTTPQRTPRRILNSLDMARLSVLPHLKPPITPSPEVP